MRIIYSKIGIPVSDFHVEEFCKNTFEYCSKYGGGETVSTENVIHCFRAMIKEGTIDHTKIVFVFEGEEIKADKNGRIAHWPEGFCDTFQNIITRLL